MSLSVRVLRTIRRHDLVPRGERVLVALSGGPDSVALLHLLRELEGFGELKVAGLAHFNHQLRGEDADEDERFCCRVAEALAIPIEVGRDDVRNAARERQRSIEDVGRTLRYEFLERAAARLAAGVIATGHTADDQAETFLLRLLRGAGPRGLAGIFPRAGRIVRPLIDVRRAELRAYAAERGLAFREDATNADLGIPRNRIRHELIPYLEREFSPGVVEVLAREAAIARSDEERLHAEAIDLLGTVVLRSSQSSRPDPATEVDAERLGSLPPALASRVAREILASAAPGRFAGFEHVERLLALARGESAAVSLPGVVAIRREGRIAIGREPPEPFSNSFRFPLSIPGEVVLADPGWAVSATWGTQGSTWSQAPNGQSHTVVAAATMRFPLTVRSRRPGDRLRPAGMGGRQKKLQDFLVDRKVARDARDRLPLVVDADDRIVWVVGYPVSEDFRVTAASQGVILLKARRLGGPG